MVSLFRYLFWTLSTVDNYCPAVVTNLRKARKVWYRLLRILGREVAEWKKSGVILRRFFRVTLLFGSYTLVVTPHVVYPGGFLPLGVAENHREASKATAVWGVGIPPDSKGAKGSGD